MVVVYQGGGSVVERSVALPVGEARAGAARGSKFREENSEHLQCLPMMSDDMRYVITPSSHLTYYDVYGRPGELVLVGRRVGKRR